MFTTLLGFSLVSLILPFVVADHHSQFSRRHNALSRRASGDVQLHKRYDNARFTYYAVGLGACGQVNVPSDFIVALDTALFGSGYPGPHCFDKITITANGKTTTATIMDECPGCPEGGLDFSQGLFEYFAPTSVGVLYGTWNYEGAAPPPPPPPPPPPAPTTTYHKTTSYPPPPPTTTYQPPPPPPSTTSYKTTPTSTWSPPPSSSSSSSLQSSSFNSSSVFSSSSVPPTSTVVSSVDLSSGAISGLAEATATAVPVNSASGDASEQEILNDLNISLLDMSALIAAAASS